MWVQCVRLFLLLHVADVHGYSRGSRHSDPEAWNRNGYNTNGYNNNRLAKNYQDYVRLRHSGHSKFARLDGVLSKLNRYKTTTTTTTTSRPISWSRYGSKRRQEITDNYDDFDYHDAEFDDEAEKAANNSEYEENADEYADDDEDDDAEDTDMQAEEATAPSTSLLTQHKWTNYGTRSRVEESRRNQMQTQTLQAIPGEDAVRSAIEHIRRVNLEGKCNTPKPKVVNIQTEHPSPGKRYIPHCTVLYRCAEDTGCCVAPDTKCQPKKQTLIHLFLYSNSLGHPGNRIEKLAFYNHTECSCLKLGTTPVDVEAPENLRAARSGLSMRSADNSYGANSIRCNCPEMFVAKVRYDSKCVCDCPPSNMDCNNMKRGKEHFSLNDRKCMIDQKCGTPTCEYGVYQKSRGRCPRKQEKLDAYASVTTTRNLN